jgi:hypothetical protein
MCRFWQVGHCALGNKCRFAHDCQELRPVADPIAGQFFLPNQQVCDADFDGMPKPVESMKRNAMHPQQSQQPRQPHQLQPKQQRQQQKAGRRNQRGQGRDNPVVKTNQVGVVLSPPPGRVGQKGISPQGYNGYADAFAGQQNSTVVMGIKPSFLSNFPMTNGHMITPGQMTAEGNLVKSQFLNGWTTMANFQTAPEFAEVEPDSPYGTDEEAFDEDPVYVSQVPPDCAVKNTFLDFGPHLGDIGGPIRHVASAEGCLTSLAYDGSPKSSISRKAALVQNGVEKQRELGAIGTVGSVGSKLDHMDSENQGEFADMRRISSVGRLDSFDRLCRLADETRPNPSDPVWVQHGPSGDSPLMAMSNSDYCNGDYGMKESWQGWQVMPSGDVVVNQVVVQTDDVWQVKNTFLDFEPQQMYPMRPVRSAMGRLADLGVSAQ